MRALGLAHYWQHLLETGRFESLTEIAAAEGLDLGQVSRIIRLNRLAPGIVGACLAGKETGLSLDILNRRGVPVEWGGQRRSFLGPRD